MSAEYFPIAELEFVAKFGFLSRDLWTREFSNRSDSRNSRLWSKFKEDGYFTAHNSRLMRNVLVLGSRGRLLLEAKRIRAVSVPGASQFNHDSKVAAAALKIQKSLLSVEFRTEAEIKRTVRRNLVTDEMALKFPDLLLRQDRGSLFKSLAVELEQSLKSYVRYKRIMEKYANFESAQAILFLSDDRKIYEAIGRAMREMSFPTWEKPIAFAPASAWIHEPITTEMTLGSRATSLRDFFA